METNQSPTKNSPRHRTNFNRKQLAPLNIKNLGLNLSNIDEDCAGSNIENLICLNTNLSHTNSLNTIHKKIEDLDPIVDDRCESSNYEDFAETKCNVLEISSKKCNEIDTVINLQPKLKNKNRFMMIKKFNTVKRSSIQNQDLQTPRQMPVEFDNPEVVKSPDSPRIKVNANLRGLNTCAVSKVTRESYFTDFKLGSNRRSYQDELDESENMVRIIKVISYTTVTKKST